MAAPHRLTRRKVEVNEGLSGLTVPRGLIARANDVSVGCEGEQAHDDEEGYEQYHVSQ